MSDAEKVADGGELKTDWTLEQDASGKIMAVKRFANMEASDTCDDGVGKSGDPIPPQTTESTVLISAEQLDVDRHTSSGISAAE